jgi:hypothetical protein
MADYKVYGYAAYEVEVHNHIKKRVIFAISMAHQPHWLSWYIYSQEMAGLWAQDFRNHNADRTARIGKMLYSAPSTLFSYSPQINVSWFAGKFGFDAATFTMVDQGPTLDCRIQLLTAAVSLNFKLAQDEARHSFLVPNDLGTVQRMGKAVDLSRTSIIAELKKGPPSPGLGGVDPFSTKF